MIVFHQLTRGLGNLEEPLTDVVIVVNHRVSIVEWHPGEVDKFNLEGP